MPKQNVNIGEKIKALRAERGLSLEEVATQSGVPAQTLADIEAQKIAPPLGDIVNLAKVFRMTVGELFGDSADSPFCIVRSDGRKSVTRFDKPGGSTGSYSYESLGHQKQDRQMEPFLVTLAPGEGRRLEANKHAGEEFIFVLSGKVEVRLAEHNDLLSPGDSIYYDANLPHMVLCHGSEPATILAVIYARKEMLIL